LHYIRQKWIDLVKPRPERSSDQFYTYRPIHFITGTAEVLRFCDSL